MITFRKLLTKAQSEEGMSLIEVVVAMIVFAIISVGVAYSTVTVSRITQDTGSRQVATNLATTEIDYIRGLQDPFLIDNKKTTTKVGKINYYIDRRVEWVDAAGADVGCGTGTGVMQSKRLNVTVTWDGMLTSTSPVRSDTLLSPDERINDPSLGTIRISVLNVAGTGSAGVGVNITPTSSGAALQEQPAVTNSDGCSFALKVAPGTYSVTVNRSGSVDTNQLASPSKSVVVAAGGSVAALFQYDYAATFSLQYASNNTSGTPALLPTNLDTTYLSTYAPYVDSSGPKSQVALHPFSSGYAGIAGKYIAPTAGTQSCVNVDPAAWPESTVSGKVMAAGVRSPNVAALPQGSTSMPIPMGLMSVKFSGAAYLFAVSTAGPSGSGDPGCAAAPTYAFGQVLKNGTINVALPYGSWVLYSATNAAGTLKTPVPASNLGLVGQVLSILGGGTTVTLDPRVAK
jgi:prepilin-type N-terminal cleavage/methylation domain-containing protein